MLKVSNFHILVQCKIGYLKLPLADWKISSYRLVKLLTFRDPEVMLNFGDVAVPASISDDPSVSRPGLAAVGGGGGLSIPSHVLRMFWNLFVLSLAIVVVCTAKEHNFKERNALPSNYSQVSSLE